MIRLIGSRVSRRARRAVLRAAFLWGGSPRTILDAARRGTLTLFTSAALIAELEDVLSRAKFAKRIADAGSSVDELLSDYLALAQLVRPTAHPPSVVRDPDDEPTVRMEREGIITYEPTTSERGETDTPSGETLPAPPQPEKRETPERKPSSVVPPDEHERARRRRKDRERQ